jgi:hypothetical protein
VENYWTVEVDRYDGDGNWSYFDLPNVHEDEIESFLQNRDQVGEQVTGSITGEFLDNWESQSIANVIFSVERLPYREMPQAQ